MIKSKILDDSKDLGEVHTIFYVFYSCLYYTASEEAGILDDSKDLGELHTMFYVFYSCPYYTASEGAGNLPGVSRCKSPHGLCLLNCSGMEQALTNLTFPPAGMARVDGVG